MKYFFIATAIVAHLFCGPPAVLGASEQNGSLRRRTRTIGDDIISDARTTNFLCSLTRPDVENEDIERLCVLYYGYDCTNGPQDVCQEIVEDVYKELKGIPFSNWPEWTSPIINQISPADICVGDRDEATCNLLFSSGCAAPPEFQRDPSCADLIRTSIQILEKRGADSGTFAAIVSDHPCSALVDTKRDQKLCFVYQENDCVNDDSPKNCQKILAKIAKKNGSNFIPAWMDEFRATESPSSSPSTSPSSSPSHAPSISPSSAPTASPSAIPSRTPTRSPSSPPTRSPSASPSIAPTQSPSFDPSMPPTPAPTPLPTPVPNPPPTPMPTPPPTPAPTASQGPSAMPSSSPSTDPSVIPSSGPSAMPSGLPSTAPSELPSAGPSAGPSAIPSLQPSSAPTPVPSFQCIDVSPDLTGTAGKFAGAAMAANGEVVFAPYNADYVGVYNPMTESFRSVSIASQINTAEKFYGAAASGDVVVFAPEQSHQVGIFDPRTDTFRMIDISTVLENVVGGTVFGYHSFRGAAALSDGRVVFPPWNSCNAGVFNPNDESFRLVDLSDHLSYCGALYNGAVALPNDLVVFPNLVANGYGLFDPSNDSFDTDTSFAYNAGGAVASNGKVIFAPSSSSAGGVTYFDPSTNTTNFPLMSDGRFGHSGAAASNDKVIFAPYSSDYVGVYDVYGEYTDFIQLPADVLSVTNKYSDAVALDDSRVVFSPYDADCVMIFDSRILYSSSPSMSPSTSPSTSPSISPSPSSMPSLKPSTPPSMVPSTPPSSNPSSLPSSEPSNPPSAEPYCDCFGGTCATSGTYDGYIVGWSGRPTKGYCQYVNAAGMVTSDPPCCVQYTLPQCTDNTPCVGVTHQQMCDFSLGSSGFCV